MTDDSDELFCANYGFCKWCNRIPVATATLSESKPIGSCRVGAMVNIVEQHRSTPLRTPAPSLPAETKKFM